MSFSESKMTTFFEPYVNLTVRVPHYEVEASEVLHQHDKWSIATAIVNVTLVTLCLCFHLVRRWHGRYVRALGGTYLFLLLANLLLVAFELHPNDDLLVASWTMEIFAVSEWLTMVLKLKDAKVGSGCTVVGGIVIGLLCSLLLLFFEPIRTIHHILMMALSGVAMVIAFSRRNNKFVRLASFCYWGTSLGLLFWDVHAPNIVEIPPLEWLHLYRIATFLGFVVSTTLSYRFRKEDPAEIVRRTKEEVVSTEHLVGQSFRKSADRRV